MFHAVIHWRWLARKAALHWTIGALIHLAWLFGSQLNNAGKILGFKNFEMGPIQSEWVRSCFDAWSTPLTKSHLCFHIRCWGSTRAYSYCTEWCQEWKDRSGECGSCLICKGMWCECTLMWSVNFEAIWVACDNVPIDADLKTLKVRDSRPHTEQVTYPVPEPAPGLMKRQSKNPTVCPLSHFFHVSWCIPHIPRRPSLPVASSCSRFHSWPQLKAGLPAAGWNYVNQHGFVYQVHMTVKRYPICNYVPNHLSDWRSLFTIQYIYIYDYVHTETAESCDPRHLHQLSSRRRQSIAVWRQAWRSARSSQLSEIQVLQPPSRFLCLNDFECTVHTGTFISSLYLPI